MQRLPKLPHVITSSYILKKHAGNPPSVTIHLYQRNFRFDGQDGSFSYVSHMRVGYYTIYCANRRVLTGDAVLY